MRSSTSAKAGAGEGARHPVEHRVMLRHALTPGAAPYGDWSTCHSVALGCRRRRRGGPRADESVHPRGLPAGHHRQPRRRRFLGQGADYPNYTYAKYGRILDSPTASPSRSTTPPPGRSCVPRTTTQGVRSWKRRHSTTRRRHRDRRDRLGRDLRCSTPDRHLDAVRLSVKDGRRAESSHRRPTGRSRWRSRRSSRSRSPAGSRSPSAGCTPTATAGSCRRALQGRSPDCSSAARCSAACSAATTPAAPASSPAQSSADGREARPEVQRPGRPTFRDCAVDLVCERGQLRRRRAFPRWMRSRSTRSQRSAGAAHGSGRWRRAP